MGQEPRCRSGVDVSLQVEEGLAYNWDRAEWKGNEIFSVAELESIFNMKSGERANGLKIDSGLKAVRTAYGRKGYIAANLATTTSFDDARQTVVYHVSVDEGDQYRMGSLNIQGLSEKDVNRLKEKWKLKPGDVYDATYIEDYNETVIKKGVGAKFKELVLRLDRDRENKLVNVSITFK